MLLTRILYKVSGRGLLHNVQFGFRPKHGTVSQLTHFIERMCKKFSKKRLTSVVSLNVPKIFDIVCVDGLLYKLSILNSLSALLIPLSSYLNCRCSKRPSKPPLFVTWGLA